MTGYSERTGSYQVPMRFESYTRGDKASSHALKVVSLPGGKWGLAECTFGQDRAEKLLPAEYDSEAAAEKAARRMNPSTQRPNGRPPTSGRQGPGTWRELDDKDREAEEDEAGE